MTFLIILVLIVLGIVAGPLIRSNFTEEQRAANVLLEALPFILIFVAIILTFITLIILAASMLNQNIPRSTYRLVERIIITGIVVQRAGYNSAFVLTAAVAAVGALWWAFGVPKIEQIELD